MTLMLLPPQAQYESPTSRHYQALLIANRLIESKKPNSRKVLVASTAIAAQTALTIRMMANMASILATEDIMPQGLLRHLSYFASLPACQPNVLRPSPPLPDQLRNARTKALKHRIRIQSDDYSRHRFTCTSLFENQLLCLRRL